MRWVNGSEIDLTPLSGNEICEKLALEMWDCREQWQHCAVFLQNAMLIIDFETVTDMEGFSTPFDGYFSDEEYSRIIEAFRAVGSSIGADILTEALNIDLQYRKLFDSTEDKNKADKLYEEFCERIENLGRKFYRNSEPDIRALLYKYLYEQSRGL